MCSSDLDESTKEQILGITVIDSIVNKVMMGILGHAQVIPAIKQILYFYKIIPSKWKNRAFGIFSKLWNKKVFLMSTNPEMPQQIYETSFSDGRIDEIIKFLSVTDRSIMYEGKSMLDLYKRGLHSEADRIKKDVKEYYGNRGLNIVNIITSGDINHLLDEINDFSNKENVIGIFDDWAENYVDIALLLSKENLNKDYIKQKIIEMAESLKKDYIIVHLASNSSDVEDTQDMINNLLRKDRIIVYESITTNIEDVGFCKTLHVIIKFKK